MPIWLRRFTFSQIQKFYSDENETIEKAQNGSKTTAIDSSGKVNTPAFAQTAKDYKPNYSTRASKK
jgi:hypothetical protein